MSEEVSAKLGALIVDDDLHAIEPMVRNLEVQGMSVSTVTNVEEALRLIEGGEQFEAIFLDITMGTGGFEELGIEDTQGGRLAGLRLAERIQRTKPGIPMVAFTAYPNMAELRDSQAFTYVVDKNGFGSDTDVWANLHARFLAKSLDQTEGWVRNSLSERDLVLYEAKPDLLRTVQTEFQEQRQQISVSVNENLLHVLKGDMSRLPQLSPREFEEVCAIALNRLGYDVTITMEGADEGIDLIAFSKDTVLKPVYLVQCKRNRFDRKVKVPILRELRCVVDDYRASGGIVMTSSYFTSKAQKYADRDQYRMQLYDVLKLKKLIEDGTR